MKRFRFSLEKVLRLRSQQMEQAKRALALAVLQESNARQAVQTVQAALAERTAEAGQRESCGLTAFEFAALRTWLQHLQKQLAQAEAELAAARERTRERRKDLLTARRKERALERLRERRLEQYNLEALREEQKEFDEYGNRQGLNTVALSTEI